MLEQVDVRERRGEPRIQVNLPAHYASEAADLAGWVASLSRTGLFLRSGRVDLRGSEVSVSIRLPGETAPLSLHGRVVRVSDRPLCPGMAIRFTSLPGATSRRLADFMTRRNHPASSPVA
jgi:uncharacterized protein (TIGR02266 family)